MDSAQSDADKIRAKRLAKLGGTQSTAPATDATPSTSSPASDGNPPVPSAGPANPFSQLGMKQEQEKKAEAPKITVKPRQTSPAKREHDGSERPRSRPRVSEKAPESIQIWQDRTLRQVLRITLKEGETKDVHGNPLVYCGNTKNELSDQQHVPTPLMTADAVEQAIADMTWEEPLAKAFVHLLTCFKRTSRAMRALKPGTDDAKIEILRETRRICMSYCIFAVTMPEMFGADSATNSGQNPLVDQLLADPECDVGICTDFLSEASSRFDEDDDSIKEAIVGAAEELSRRLSALDMLADYVQYIRALRNLLRFPKIADAITQSSIWAPDDIEPQDIETKTLLGPFFRISPMQQQVANNYFSSPSTRDRAFIANAQNAIRMTLRTHQSELFQIADGIVRAGPAQRERILNWFALCVNKNHKKRAMRVDHKIVSSDGFMVNVTTTLDQLCEPFMDARFGKIEKIDVNYLRRNPRVHIADETKINVDQKASDEYFSQKVEGTNNFISEVFFLTVAAHHYGTEAAQTSMVNSQKSVQRFEKDLAQFEKERHKYINDPRYLQRFEEQLARFKKTIDDMKSSIHATHGVLTDDLSQARSMQFMRYVIVWLLRLASQQDIPKETLKLPLPTSEQPDVFRCLPEYFLEDIVDNFKFITSNIPQIITPQQSEEIVQICVTFLRSSEYVKNPGVKSGFVSILFYGVMPYHNRARGVLGDLLIGSPFANKHLLHALMKFYIEAENTGTHTQFFDKFNIRYEIFQVIKCIWVNTMYRENLAKEAEINTDFFVQFVNMLVNDATFVLDESLSSFVKIKELTRELGNASIMADLTEEQRKEKQELLDEQKGRAKNYMQLTRETMETLILFTETLAGAFTMKEIVTRLADMLDYNLNTMVGPQSGNLKVGEAREMKQEYGFDPAQLLSDIVTVYLNLSSKSSFVTAIARDGRSYKPENFQNAVNILERVHMKSPDELRVWRDLAAKVAEAKALEEQEEEDLGEIPDEFLDPLVFDIMSDPVILPLSKNVIDRSTIRSHLLSDPTDPFNRTPLKIEDVIPDTQMKERIEAWKAERKAERAKERMDTSEG